MNTNPLLKQIRRVPVSLPQSVQAMNIIKAAKTGRRACCEESLSRMVIRPAVGFSNLLLYHPPMPGIVTSLSMVIAARKENPMKPVDKHKAKASSPNTSFSIISFSSSLKYSREKGSPLAALDYLDSISIITSPTATKKADKKRPRAKKTFGTASSIWGSMAMCLVFFGAQSPNNDNMPALPCALDLGHAPSLQETLEGSDINSSE